MKPTLQARVEASDFGRSVISGLLLFVLFALVVWNLPDSELKRRTLGTVRPVVVGVGLDQVWSVFAPDPRHYSMELMATIKYADGAEDSWRYPRRREPFLSPFRSSRWEKWADNVRIDDRRVLWHPTAAWLARTHQHRGRPVEVTLIRGAQFSLPPGPGPDRAPPDTLAFFRMQVTPEILRGDDTSLSMWTL